ncbi:hypothetical protein ACH42_00945 [Endozoicomonas sp. (ex Bugula neritina AB1)]|nr:hypothetical protein ACH42_00945 [Endozoicomonas sp. (ex Bugula neritina AB1)]
MKASLKTALKTVVTTIALAAAIPAAVSAAPVKDNIRIVSAGSGVTEIIYALGAGDKVVAADATSNFPAEVNELPKLGYHKQLSAEGILAMAPTMLVGSADMGPPATLNQLKGAGLTVKALPVDNSVESIETRIDALASLLGKEKEGEQLWQDISESLEQAQTLADSHEKKTRVMFVLAMGGRTPTVAGEGSAANAIMNLAGGYNIAAEDFKGYKALSNEALLLLAPEVIVYPGSVSNPDMTPEKILEQMPILKQTPAGKNGRIVAIDGTLLLGGLGPRTGDLA